ncbi:hypothetical protein C4K68_28395 [Pokkaliibacter plantistimulans]|uniref:Cytoplasmic protein n=1 Tax=Proteobacteria bacterium 228 TaxID=2083153 RepID=A0A2S5KGV2_9PROT|nr:hypothetical protein [Pokkaliibacter plantistimulans]PPC74034.1 hypothetical protein C4K68_28395 [Pokkaliibacter plantistimulans]
MYNEKKFSAERLMALEERACPHVWNNKEEIMRSDICLCLACYQIFIPSEIRHWQDDKSAVCPYPNCCFGGSVIGSASGLNFDDYIALSLTK